MNRGVIDIGNTRVKAAVFNNEGSIIKLQKFDKSTPAFDWIRSEGVKTVMAASVGQHISENIDGLRVISLSMHSNLPFVNLYQTPETLGVDRIAVMAAASIRYKGKAVLVFDIGTCMTIDLLQPDNTYSGGNISPGIEMRLRAMHEMTGRLPLALKSEATDKLGNSSRTAIASGVITGMHHEILGYINEYRKQYPGLITILCGGDHSHFEFPPEFGIFADQNFVLQGLYQLLLLNEK